MEYYVDTCLLACFAVPQQNKSVVQFHGPISKLQKNKKHYDKLQIGSRYWTMKIEAENDEEAIKLFIQQVYSRE